MLWVAFATVLLEDALYFGLIRSQADYAPDAYTVPFVAGYMLVMAAMLGASLIHHPRIVRAQTVLLAGADKSDTAHVFLLDTGSGKARQLATSRSSPAFLNSHWIFYQEERPCAPSDLCPIRPTILSGKTFIYDLQDSTESESRLARVFDSWPHPA